MPLTAKGREIMAAMKKQYGEEKGESVFYAARNAGTISGVDASLDAVLDEAVSIMDALSRRADRLRMRIVDREVADARRHLHHVTLRRGS